MATGTSTDTLLIGLTQQGKKISNAGSGTVVGKGIGQMVYRAIKKRLVSSYKGFNQPDDRYRVMAFTMVAYL